MVKVIGIGSGGSNAVNMLIEAGIDSDLVELIAVNTDDSHLQGSLAAKRIQMGENLTYGLGARGMPEIGRKAAEESIDEISLAIAGVDLLFITAGMGGGTGTGGAPVIASIAKDMNILTVGVVTKPFIFEGEQRMGIAEDGIRELRQHVDTLIIIQNQRLSEMANSNTPLKEVLIKGNEVLLQGVRNISDLISRPNKIELGSTVVHALMSDICQNSSLYHCYTE